MLDEREDAFGKALFDYYKNKGEHLVIERDDGYCDILEMKHYFTEFEQWSEYQKEAMYYVEGKVLDIGCGAGRHCLYLQKNGLDVVGIDNSPLAIKVCKLRGVKEAEMIDLHEMKEDLGIFDTIIMLGNNFALFGNPTAAKKTLKKFFKMTSENGRIVAECMDPYPTDNQDHLEYHARNRTRGRYSGQITVRFRYLKHISSWGDLLFLSKEEMKEIIKETGWKITNFIDNNETSHYLAIIEKEKT